MSGNFAEKAKVLGQRTLDRVTYKDKDLQQLRTILCTKLDKSRKVNGFYANGNFGDTNGNINNRKGR